MTTTELSEADALVMAAECPLIRAAYASGDDEVIRRTEAAHPPKRCEYVKRAAAEQAAAEAAASTRHA